MATFSILTGSAPDVLPGLPDGSFRCAVTSPPYWRQRDYGHPAQIGQEAEPGEYVRRLVDVFRVVRDKLAADGVLWVNLGDVYAARASSRYGAKGASTTAPRVAQLYRVPKGMKHKDVIGLPWALAAALRADGWWVRSVFPWVKFGVHAEPAAQDRFANVHEYWIMLSKSRAYFWDKGAVAARYGRNRHSRDVFLQGLDALVADLDRYREHVLAVKAAGGLLLDPDGLPAAYLGAVNRSGRKHYAAFPEAMVEPLIAACSEPGDRVLDPFGGSGTVGAAALRLGRHFTGIELVPEYVALAESRLRAVTPSLQEPPCH